MLLIHQVDHSLRWPLPPMKKLGMCSKRGINRRIISRGEKREIMGYSAVKNILFP